MKHRRRILIRLSAGLASLLEPLVRGEHDAALTDAPGVEAALDVQALLHDRRSVAVNHPGAKLFVNWIASGQGRRTVAGVRGYRVPVKT